MATLRRTSSSMYTQCTAWRRRRRHRWRHEVQKLGSQLKLQVVVHTALTNIQRSTGSQLRRQPLQHRRGAGPQRRVGRNAGSYQIHDALHATRGMCFISYCTVRKLQAIKNIASASVAHLWTLVRCAWQAPRASPQHGRQGHELYQQDAQGIHIGCWGAPPSEQHLWCDMRVGKAHHARCGGAPQPQRRP